MKKTLNTKNGRVYISFDGSNTDFEVGNKFKYILDAKTNKLFIVKAKDKEKNHTISKKKTSKKILSLIDLRSKIIKGAFQDSKLDITITKDKIIVHSISNHKENVCYEINREELRDAVGLDFNTFSKGSIKYNFGSINSTKDDEELKNELSDVLKVASLFSGAGMLDYPFKIDSNFEIVFANELDKDAGDSYINNIGDHLVRGSIVDIDSIPCKVDVIIGGPPCKPFSNVNRNSNCRLDTHPDSKLMLEYIRLVNKAKPKVFVMENVPQILTACGGKYYDAIKNAISPEYELTDVVVKDCDCGGYSTRKRAFVFGSRIGKMTIPVPKLNPLHYKTVRQALDKVNFTWKNFKDTISSSPIVQERMSYIEQGSNYISSAMNMPERLRIKARMANAYRRLKEDSQCCTLVNFGKSCITHPIEDRIISVAEALALSGFNSDFEILGAKGTKPQQVGNGVPFHLGYFVKNIIRSFLNKK